MARYRIEFEVELSDEATYDEVYEWARFNLNDNGVLERSILSDVGITPVPFSVDVIDV